MTGFHLETWSTRTGQVDSVFGQTYAQEFYLPESRTQQEIASLGALIRFGQIQSMVDIGCGEGRTLLPLARALPDVSFTGLEYHANRLPVEEDRPDNVTLVQGDMRNLEFADGSFDFAAMMFTTFGYFTDASNKAALGEAIRVVGPGGYVLVDSPNSEAILARFEPSRTMQTYEVDGAVVEVDYSRELWVDDSQPRDPRLSEPTYLLERRTLRSDGRELSPLALRFYTRDDYVALGEELGARVVGFYENTLDPFSPDTSRRMWVLLQKEALNVPVDDSGSTTHPSQG